MFPLFLILNTRFADTALLLFPIFILIAIGGGFIAVANYQVFSFLRVFNTAQGWRQERLQPPPSEEATARPPRRSETTNLSEHTLKQCCLFDVKK